jgi:hypothetical protein
MSCPGKLAESSDMTLDREALDAAVDTLRLTLDTTPARWSEDTADELLTLVQLTFHDYIVEVLADPMPAGLPEEGRPALAVRAALHGRAVADLLTALAIKYWKETGEELSELDVGEAPRALTRRWIEEMSEAAVGDDSPAHETAVDYVRGVAIALSFVARILGAQRGLSLDPVDPRGPVEYPDAAMTGDDAGALLIWCGAAALCIAATLQPRFRVRSAS